MGEGFFAVVGTETVRGLNPPQSGMTVAEESSAGRPQFGSGYKRWGAVDGTAFYGVAETHDALPAGFYRCQLTAQGPMLVKQRVETDNLLELPDDAGATIIAEFKRFWEIGEKFRERGFLHKRGYLLWGPPGSGKTSTLQRDAGRGAQAGNPAQRFVGCDRAHAVAPSREGLTWSPSC